MKYDAANDPSNNSNRFNSIAGVWSNSLGHYVRWYCETETEESRIEWFDGSLVKTKFFKTYDCAQKYYLKLLQERIAS